MRIAIDHRTSYCFTEPQARVVQLLRMTPLDHEAQSVIDWRIDVECDARLREQTDGYGNIVTMLYIDGPIERLDITVHGEVLTEDRDGILKDTPEPLPADLFRRTTALTAASPQIAAFAREKALGRGWIERLHTLNKAIRAHAAFVDCRVDPNRTAADVFRQRRGVSRDLAHLFVAAARALDVPARYVSGHCLSVGGPHRRSAHAWAEAHVDGLGWVGFDPAVGHSPDETYVRVACGLDATHAMPISGSRIGGGAELLDVDVQVGTA
jgi:transglutaminase-like putative cysteine protease